jgi:hypothetical protein
MKRLFLFAAIILFIAGCNKEDDKITHHIPQQYIDWFYFNKGSYWIYDRNDLSGPDTLAVDTTIFLIVTNTTPPYDEEEYMKITYDPNPLNITYDHLTATSALGRNFTDNAQYPIYDLYNSEVGRELLMYDGYGNVVGTSKLESLNAGYTIGENTFDSVMVVLVDDFVKTKLIRYYLAKGIGTAKIETIESGNTTTWVVDQWVVVNGSK